MVLVRLLSIFCDHFFFPLFLGFALHNIHAFHARLFFIYFFKKIKINKKRKEKGRQMCSALSFLNLKTRLAILSLHNIFMCLV